MIHNNDLWQQSKIQNLDIDHSRIIFLFLSGSHLYGTSGKGSDYDWRGVWVPPVKDYIGYEEIKDIVFGEDGKLYDLRKFMKLAFDCNPNIVEWLYAPKKMVAHLTREGHLLREALKGFINPAKVKGRYVGYAETEWNKVRKITAKSGAKRKNLVKKYSYDVKSASNVVRLLSEAHEIIAEETLTLPRPDADILQKIKKGKLTFGQVESMVKLHRDRLDNAVAVDRVQDIEKLEELLMQFLLIT
jgi:predicted nucleotidyltransferase